MASLLPAFNVKLNPSNQLCAVRDGAWKVIPEQTVAAMRAKLDKAEQLGKTGFYRLAGEKSVMMITPDAYQALKG